MKSGMVDPSFAFPRGVADVVNPVSHEATSGGAQRTLPRTNGRSDEQAERRLDVVEVLTPVRRPEGVDGALRIPGVHAIRWETRHPSVGLLRDVQREPGELGG